MGIEFHDVSSDHARTRASEEADAQKRSERKDGERAKVEAGRFQQALRAPGPPKPGEGKANAQAKEEGGTPKDTRGVPGEGDAASAALPGPPTGTPQTKANPALDERLARLARNQAQRAEQFATLPTAPPKGTGAGETGDAHAAASLKKPPTPEELLELPAVKERSEAGRDSRKQADDTASNASLPTGIPLAVAGPRSDAPTAAPTPRGAIPEGLLKQLVEYAAVHQRSDGVFEFRLGLSQGVLGGARMKMQAHGNRRVSLQVVGGRDGGVSPEELASLVEALKARGLDVVEATIS